MVRLCKLPLCCLIFLIVISLVGGCISNQPRHISPTITATPTATDCRSIDSNKADICGDNCYNEYNSDCCGGSVYPKGGTCCAGKWYPYSQHWECCPNIYSNIPEWRTAEQFYINTDTQHCCMGKVAVGGYWTGDNVDLEYMSKGNAAIYPHWEDCGEEGCIDQVTQSCCQKGYDQNQSKFIYKIQAKNSCCAGRPTPPPGYYCEQNTGYIIAQSGSSSGNLNPGWQNIPRYI